MIRTALLFMLLATVAVAQTLNEGEEIVPLEWFEDHVEGFTLHFERDGAFAGSEMFMEDRKVRWQFPSGQCQDGIWYEEEGAMCFAYEGGGPPQCWNMIRQGDAISARPREATDTSADLFLNRRTVVQLSCGGPFLGA